MSRFLRGSWRVPDVDVEAMYRLYETGVSLDEAAAAFGTTRRHATRLLRAAGFEVRPRAESIRIAKRRA